MHRERHVWDHVRHVTDELNNCLIGVAQRKGCDHRY